MLMSTTVDAAGFTHVDQRHARELVSHPDRSHLVQFYDSDQALSDRVTAFLLAGVAASEPLLVIATPEHCEAFKTALRSKLFDVDRALAVGQLTMLDAGETLATFMVDGTPDPTRFDEVVGGAFPEIQRAHPKGLIRAYGEMVDVLVREGNSRAALMLESLWNELSERCAFSLLCAYGMQHFSEPSDRKLFEEVCGTHSHVLPQSANADRLQQHARMLELEIEHRKQLASKLHEALDERTSAQETLSALYRVSKLLHAELEVEKVVQRLTDEATALCRAELGAFFYNAFENGEGYPLYTLSGVPRERFAKFPMPRNTGVFGPTFSGEAVVRLDDVTADPRYGKNAPYHGMPKGHLPVKSYLAISVVSRTGEVLGGLFFGHSQPGVFTQRDEDLLVAIGVQAATAIENAKLYEAQSAARAAAETSQRRTERLHGITAQLARALGAEEVAKIALEEMRAVIGAESGSMILLDRDGTRIERSMLHGDESAHSREIVRTLALSDDFPACEAARTGRVVWGVGAEFLDKRYPHLKTMREAVNAQTWGALPIRFEGKTLAALGMRCSVERRLSEDERVFLEAIGRQCGQALERARLHDLTEAAKAEAEKASRAKDEFLAMLGHELRNPLSPILTAVQLMKMRGDTASSREHDIIKRQVSHLIHLVDDLLDISRITRGKVELDKKPLKLAAILSKAIEMASPLLEERRHHLEVALPDEDIWLEGDEVRLCQVLTNLLTNAAKYTNGGGEISIRARREGSDVMISIKDNGIGMGPDLLPQVFDLFVQGMRTSDRALGGLGIGLALVRTLVGMHGGVVTAASDGLDRGSTFTVRLPTIALSRVSTPPADDRPLRTRLQVTPRRVLVVDDNQDAASLLGDMLESVGHEVLVAFDGPHAIEGLKHFQPEVAILDIGLPVMDGYELAQLLRDRLGAEVRLMAVTGYGQEQDRMRAEVAGFDAHFVKPVGLGKLLAAIEVHRSGTIAADK